MNRIVTLNEFIIEKQNDFSFPYADLTNLLNDIGAAAKIIHREVNKAGLVNILGSADEAGPNASGEQVQKLDLYANDLLIEYLGRSGECCGVGSEELDSFTPITKTIKGKDANYIVVFDPLDGSSNIDVNVNVGTIFGIYRRISEQGNCELKDFLQSGCEQVGAGYVLYGTSTMLVYSTGNGVNGFTLDPSIGEFCLSHPDIKIPNEGPYYSINQGHYLKFDEGMKKYVDDCQKNGLGLRYIGSMVADVHRTLFKGGIFIYPNTVSHQKGKLRLVYECNPLGYIVEQAGGKATTCQGAKILDLKPSELHERSSVAMGSESMVDTMLKFTANS